jgi:hypothetical protein
MNAESAVGRLALLAFLGGTILAGAAQERAAAGKTAPPVRSLIRKEWIKPPAVPPAPPRRDIFSPQGGGMIDEERTPLPGIRPGGQAVVQKKADEAGVPPAFDLRYIGFSQAGASKKIVALVLFEGQAAAIEEGDTIGPGHKVLKITAQQIEIQAPDGKTLTFVWVGAER